MRRFYGYMGLTLLLTAAALLAVSHFIPSIIDRSWSDAYKTTGQVTGFVQYGETHIPLVTFVAKDGMPYLFEVDDINNTLNSGQAVTVRYFLLPELRASLMPDLSAHQLAFAIFGCLLAAFGFASLIHFYRKTALTRYLSLYGARLTATVSCIEPALRFCLFGRQIYTVIVTVRSPQGIGEVTIKNKLVVKPCAAPAVGGAVPVFMDESNHKQCEILWKQSVSAHAGQSHVKSYT